MSSIDPQVVASIIAALTALVAVIIGPFLSIRAAKTQMLGPMRQAWINDLRDTMAEFVARIQLGYGVVGDTSTHDDAVRHAARTTRIEHIQVTKNLLHKIALLINPLEEDHQELLRLARSAHAKYMSGMPVETLVEPLLEQTQRVLKREWNVVKA